MAAKRYAPGDICPACKEAKLEQSQQPDQPLCVRCPHCARLLNADPTRTLHRQIAEEIVEDLFTDSHLGRASRLVLELANRRQLGGWADFVVVDRIAKILDARHFAEETAT